MQAKENKIISEFSLYSSWEEKYEHLIEIGKEIPLIKSSKKTPDYLIQGCQSNVWLDCEKKEGRLYFSADSDALISKGLAALIIQLFSGSTALEIVNYKNTLFEKIQLNQHLSMTRANGLLMMIKKIQNYAKKNL